jgi:hypothetical protein
VQQRCGRRELGRGFDARLRRDVAAVEHGLLVGTSLDDANDTKRGVGIREIARTQEAQVERSRLHRFGFVASVRVVAQVFVDHAVSEQVLVGRFAEVHFCHAHAGDRSSEVDDFALNVRGHIERQGHCVGGRDLERRAVWQHSAGSHDADLAKCQQALVEDQLTEAPRVSARGPHAHVDQMLQMPRLLLEMVGLQEHALRPDDFGAMAHRSGAARVRPWR